MKDGLVNYTFKQRYMLTLIDPSIPHLNICLLCRVTDRDR